MRIPKGFAADKKPRYGYYYCKPYVAMLLVFLVFGAAVNLFGRKTGLSVFNSIGIVIGLYGIVTTLGWALARYVIPGNRIQVRKEGESKILDCPEMSMLLM